jgi:hypothetical protein
VRRYCETVLPAGGDLDYDDERSTDHHWFFYQVVIEGTEFLYRIEAWETIQ